MSAHTRKTTPEAITAGPPGAALAGSRILLFNTPWVSPSHAPLGLGIVARLLADAGAQVTTSHPNVGFYGRLADAIGERAARAFYDDGEVGEVAAGLLYRQERHPFDRREPLDAFLAGRGVPPAVFWGVVRHLRDYTAGTLDALDYRDVAAAGFTLCIRQTMSSLYWAQQLTRRAPHVKVVFGGSTCEDPMGLALLESHDVIDAIARGEADDSIVELFGAVIRADTAALAGIANVAGRDGGAIVTGPRRVVDVTRAVPPDHDAFVEAYRAVEARTGEPANLYLEASRGCWWGERRHCAFCGIHTSAIEFREKPAGAVLDEVRGLLGRHRAFRFVLADTILSRRHFETLLPALAELRAEHDLEFLVDVKSPLDAGQADALRRAGCVALQVGIEAFSDRLLRLMGKGNTALVQLQSLKRCTEAGIHPYYVILTHVPHEEPADYDEALAHTRRAHHLPPPAGVFPIEVNRYAPYFRDWEALGIARPAPAGYYRLMFGPDGTDLDAFAYHFEGRHPTTATDALERARRGLLDDVAAWAARRAKLSYRVGAGFVRVSAAPAGRPPQRHDLEGPEAELFRACDEVSPWRDLRARFAATLGEAGLRRRLEDWVDAGWLTRSGRGDVYLGLALCEHRRPCPPAGTRRLHLTVGAGRG